MRCLVLVVMVGACGGGRTLEVASAPQTLAEITGPGAELWSNTTSLGLSPTGSNHFPSPLTLRLRVFELCGHDDGDECDHDLASGSVAVVAGSPCAITIPTSCAGTSCFTELQLTGLGNCLLQVRVATTDDYDDATCWYRAVYEADDPFDDVKFGMLESQTDHEVAACNSDL
jgi:hypothetical protein